MKYVLIEAYGELKPGDQIARLGRLEDLHQSLKSLFVQVVVSDSPYYFHHGVYMGDLTVVHLQGHTKTDAKPRQVDLKVFADNGVGRMLFRVDYEGVETFPPDVTIRMAKELISNSDDKSKWPKFSIIWNNCETMATYLKTGVKQSIQASKALFRSACMILGSSPVCAVVSAVSVAGSMAS